MTNRFSRDEMTACERCGAYVPKVLAPFHKCRGSNKRLRPANIPLEQWLRTRSLTETLEYFASESVKTPKQGSVTNRVKVKYTPAREPEEPSSFWIEGKHYTILLVLAIVLAALATAALKD